jgi:hypothetical protein
MTMTAARARGWYLAIEGPTGVGKTTLAGRLAPLLAADLFLDPFDANPFLTQITGDRQPPGSDMALVAELTFLALRVAELRRIHAALCSGRNVIADWALAKTMVFPRTTLPAGDAERIEAACRLWEPHLSVPDLIIYLHADPAVLAARISRRGRAFEQAITLTELGRLTGLFGAALCGLPVLPVDAAAFDVFDDTTVTALARRLSIIRKDTADDRHRPCPTARQASPAHRARQGASDRRAAPTADRIPGTRPYCTVRDQPRH